MYFLQFELNMFDFIFITSFRGRKYKPESVFIEIIIFSGNTSSYLLCSTLFKCRLLNTFWVLERCLCLSAKHGCVTIYSLLISKGSCREHPEGVPRFRWGRTNFKFKMIQSELFFRLLGGSWLNLVIIGYF